MFFFFKKKLLSFRNENLRKSGSRVKLQTGVLQIKIGSRGPTKKKAKTLVNVSLKKKIKILKNTHLFFEVSPIRSSR